MPLEGSAILFVPRGIPPRAAIVGSPSRRPAHVLRRATTLSYFRTVPGASFESGYGSGSRGQFSAVACRQATVIIATPETSYEA